MDQERWKVLFESMWRKTPTDEQTFIDIVDSIETPLSKDTIRALFKTYLPIDDFGTQESVSAKLSSADTRDYFDVLTEELPDLIVRAPEHGDDIILRGIIFNPNEMQKCLLNMDKNNIQIMVSFISDRLNPEPEAIYFLDMFNKRSGNS
jgi:hypothetical protein